MSGFVEDMLIQKCLLNKIIIKGKSMLKNKSVLISFSQSILKMSILAATLLPILAFASNGETPVSEGLSYIVSAMYGATGIAIATIAVMIVGLLCLFHFLNWSALGKTIIGISLVFGAGAVVNGIVSLVHMV
jgi:type IV secretory pathway VirB2 component (pilin)